MSITHQSSYTFKLDNKHFIDLISKYNKSAYITSVKIGENNGISTKFHGRNLEKFLAFLNIEDNQQEINLEYRSINSEDLSGIFPKIQPDELQSIINTLPSEEIKYCKTVAKFFTRHANEALLGDQSRYPFPKAFFTYPDLRKELQKPTNFQHAVFLLNHFNKELTLSDAIHIESLKVILFQRSFETVCIYYGDKLQVNCLSPDIALDLNDGFFNNDSSNWLVDVLNKEFFNKWKANGYSGELFPAERNGFASTAKREAAQSLKASPNLLFSPKVINEQKDDNEIKESTSLSRFQQS